MQDQLDALHHELQEALLLPDSVERDASLAQLVTATAELVDQAEEMRRSSKRELCKVACAMGGAVAFFIGTMLLAAHYGR